MIRIEQLTTVVGHGAEEILVLDRLDFSAEARAIVVPQLAPTKSAAEVIGAAHQHKLWLCQLPEANSEFAGQLTIGTTYARAADIKKLAAAFTDPTVQKFLGTDASVKSILLPLDAR